MCAFALPCPTLMQIMLEKHSGKPTLAFDVRPPSKFAKDMHINMHNEKCIMHHVLEDARQVHTFLRGLQRPHTNACSELNENLMYVLLLTQSQHNIASRKT